MFRHRPNKEWGRKARKGEDQDRNLHGADRDAAIAEGLADAAAEQYVVVVQRERDSWGEDGWSSYWELDDVIGPFGNYADAARRELAEMQTYTRTEVKKLIEP